ncbi:MAG TPA: hypothetical protein DIT01_22245, partial [Lentisphaeria bacterium]|nr:hypothetical protein [Lentisphaeria bacterium]
MKRLQQITVIVTGLLVMAFTAQAATNIFPADGDVGIGTVNPFGPTKLHVVGHIRSDGTHWFYASDETTLAGYVGDGANLGGLTSGEMVVRSAGGLGLWTSNSVRAMHLTSIGDVGIGTFPVAPAAKLDVAGAVNVQAGMNVSGDVGIGTLTPFGPTKLHVVGNIRSDGTLWFYDSTGNTLTGYMGDGVNLGGGGADDMIVRAADHLGLWTGGGSVKAVNITNLGDVGIGGTSGTPLTPTAKLDVDGTVRVRDLTASSSDNIVVAEANGDLRIRPASDLAGAQGPQGEQGPAGDDGAQGPQGDAGADGAAGAAGA